MKKFFTALALASSVLFGYVIPAIAQTETTVVPKKPLPAPTVQRADLLPADTIKITGFDSTNPTVSITIQNRGNASARASRTWIGYHAFGKDEGERGEVTKLERSTAAVKIGKQIKLSLKPKSSKVSLDDIELIEVYADSKKSVSESSEENNAAYYYLEDMDEEGYITARLKDEEAGDEGEEEDIIDTAPKDKTKPEIKPEIKSTPQPKPEPRPADSIPWRNVKQNSGTVSLFSVYPAKAAVGIPLTIRGTGFLKQGNAVVFDSGYILDVASSDLETLAFTIPEDRVPLCALMQPACMQMSPYNPVTPGIYKVSVVNVNGWSLPLSVTVLSKTELKEDPYKPVYNDSICLSLGALLPGCHKLPENDGVRFDSTESKYIYSGMRNVQLCKDWPVVGCNRTQLYPTLASTTVAVPPVATTTLVQTPPPVTATLIDTSTQTNTTISSATATALAYRSGLYFKDAWVGCMTRMGSTAEMKKVQDYLNAGQFPPPWGVFTGTGATAIATCEREAGWTGYDSGTGSTSTNWVNHTWKFKDGSSQYSSILSRTDSEYTSFIASVDAATPTGYFGGWKAGGGDQSNWREFGIPVVSPTATQSGTTSSGGYGYSSTEAQTGCTTAGGTWDATAMYCKMPGSTTGSGSWSSCNSTQYWNGTACVAMSTSGSTGSGSTSCGAGYNWNGSSCVTSCSSGQYWTGTSCQTSTTGGSTSCPSGQYWSGTSSSCVSSMSGSSCTSGQYWNGSACVSSSSTDMSTQCATAGGSWNSSSNYCQMPSSTSGSSSYSTESMISGCASAGGTWTGTYCRMPGMSTRVPSQSQLANTESIIEAIRKMLSKLR